MSGKKDREQKITWPFRPSRITLENDSSKGQGIVAADYLQGIQTTIANQLQNPTTIVEFPADGSDPKKTNALSIHLDLHPPCSTFRKQVSDDCCNRCDTQHAALFKGLKKSNFAEFSAKQCHQNEFIKNYLNLNPDSACRFKKSDMRSYLEYDCPLLGFRELMFPVFFNEYVIGIFITGQLVLEGKGNLINRTQELFFKNPEQIDAQFTGKKNDIKQCQAKVSELTEKWIKVKPYNNNQYNDFITEASRQLDNLEKTLYKEAETIKNRYIMETFNDIVKKFRSDVSADIWENTLVADEVLDRFWQIGEKSVKRIKESFAFKFICIFGLRFFHSDVPRELDSVIKTGDFSGLNGPSGDIGNIKFDLDKIPAKAKINMTSSEDEKLLFKGLPENFTLNQEENFIRTFPFSFYPQGILVVWIGYDNRIWNPLREKREEDKRANQVLENSGKSFDTVVSSVYASILAKAAGIAQELALRIYSHEGSQLTAGLQSIKRQYLSSGERLKNLAVEKLDDICHDIDGLLHQLNLLFKKPKLIQTKLEVKKEKFWPYSELLFKWENIYRLETRWKNLQFNIHRPLPQESLRPKISGDKILLELLLYNVIYNAIKYCYRGTQIYIDCRKKSHANNSPYLLTVTDYGKSIEEDEKPYQAGYRGKNVKGLEGLGLGLHIARKIVLAHGGSISHTRKKISQYNIPLIKSYLRIIDTHNPRLDNLDKLRNEDERLKKEGYYHKIIACNKSGKKLYSNPYKHVLLDEIIKPTWEVTFTVAIPS